MKLRNVFCKIFIVVLAIGMPFWVNSSQKKEVSISTDVQSVIKSNNALAIVAENAQVLFLQIKNNMRNEMEKKQALRFLAQEEKKLSVEIKKMVAPHLVVIKNESDDFYKHNKPLAKYDSSTAEKAFVVLNDMVEDLVKKSSDSMAVSLLHDIEKALIETEKVHKSATVEINKIREQRAVGQLALLEATKLIAQENRRVAVAEKKLKDLTEKAVATVEKNDEHVGYLSQLVLGSKALGSTFIAPLQAGYFASEEDKDIARAVITALEDTKFGMAERYNDMMARSDISVADKKTMTALYQKEVQDINREIYQQKVITGDAWSAQRRLFWGSVALAAAGGIGFMAKQYFGVPQMVENYSAKPLREDVLARQSEEISDTLALRDLQAQRKELDEDYSLQVSENRNHLDDVSQQLNDFNDMNFFQKKWNEDEIAALEKERTSIVSEMQNRDTIYAEQSHLLDSAQQEVAGGQVVENNIAVEALPLFEQEFKPEISTEKIVKDVEESSAEEAAQAQRREDEEAAEVKRLADQKIVDDATQAQRRKDEEAADVKRLADQKIIDDATQAQTRENAITTPPSASVVIEEVQVPAVTVVSDSEKVEVPVTPEVTENVSELPYKPNDLSYIADDSSGDFLDRINEGGDDEDGAPFGSEDDGYQDQEDAEGQLPVDEGSVSGSSSSVQNELPPFAQNFSPTEPQQEPGYVQQGFSWLDQKAGDAIGWLAQKKAARDEDLNKKTAQRDELNRQLEAKRAADSAARRSGSKK